MSVRPKGRTEVRRTKRLAKKMGVEYWPKGNGKRFDKAKARFRHPKK